MFVDQDAHQFRHSDRRMRIIKLDRGLLREITEVLMLGEVSAHQVLQGSRGKEIFLTQAQLFARWHRIARVKNVRYGLRPHAICVCADMIAAIECVKAQWIGPTRRPQAQRVNVPTAPAHHWRVVGNSLHNLRRMPDVPRGAALRSDGLDGPAEADCVIDLWSLELPGVTERKPIFGVLLLPPVLDHLAEKAVIVPDTVTICGDR